MYLIDRFSQLLRCEVVLHFINTWDMKYPLSRNFYVRTCVKFAFANKIKAMYERLHVQLCKRKSRNSLNLTFNLNILCLTSIWFTWLKFALTCGAKNASVEIHPNVSHRTLYLQHLMSIVDRNPISSFSGTGWSKNSMAWKRWLFWNNWPLQWSKKKRIILMSKTSRFTGKSGSRIEDREIRDQGSVKKNLKIK